MQEKQRAQNAQRTATGTRGLLDAEGGALAFDRKTWQAAVDAAGGVDKWVDDLKTRIADPAERARAYGRLSKSQIKQLPQDEQNLVWKEAARMLANDPQIISFFEQLREMYTDVTTAMKSAQMTIGAVFGGDGIEDTTQIYEILAPYIDAEYDDHPDHYEQAELTDLITAAAQRARADGKDIPTLWAEQGKVEIDDVVKRAIFRPDRHALTFSGDVLSKLAKARTRGDLDGPGNLLTIEDFELRYSNAKAIGIGEAKLLRYGISAFTKANAQNTKAPKLRVYADTREFARACRVRIDPETKPTLAEQEKENKRAEKALENFVSKIGRSARNIAEATVTWSEKIRGKAKKYSGMNLLGYYDISREVIMFEFTQKMAEYLTCLPLTDTPRAYYAIDDRKPNAFAIADELIKHYNIDNNVIRNTERILKVETLLKHTSFPSASEIREKRNSWAKMVKEPFEAAMEELYQKGLIAQEQFDATGKRISGGWRYCLSGMHDLTDAEAGEIANKSYADFVSLYVAYELADYEPHETRAKAIADKIAKDKERKAKRRRKKPTATTNKDGAGEAAQP